jgi:hypothetical protein
MPGWVSSNYHLYKQSKAQAFIHEAQTDIYLAVHVMRMTLSAVSASASIHNSTAQHSTPQHSNSSLQ